MPRLRLQAWAEDTTCPTGTSQVLLYHHGRRPWGEGVQSVSDKKGNAGTLPGPPFHFALKAPLIPTKSMVNIRPQSQHP